MGKPVRFIDDYLLCLAQYCFRIFFSILHFTPYKPVGLCLIFQEHYSVLGRENEYRKSAAKTLLSIRVVPCILMNIILCIVSLSSMSKEKA